MAEVGVRLPVTGPLASPQAVRAVAEAAERASFGYVSANDSVAWSSLQHRTHISSGSVDAVRLAGEDQPPTFLEPLSTLSFVAAATTRIRLLLSVLVLPFRHPVLAAKQVANLDVLSDGRLIVGVGVGATRERNSTNFELLDIPRTSKYERTVDYLKAMRAVWEMEHPSYSGPFVHFAATQVDPKPVQRPHPPIWVGGSGSRAQRMAAEFGDGWLPAGVSKASFPGRIAELRGYANEFGRAMPRVCYIGPALIASTSQRAWDAALPTLKAKSHDGREPGRDTGLIGSADDIVETIREYQRLGVSSFELLFIYHSVEHYLEQLDQFAADVLPYV